MKTCLPMLLTAMSVVVANSSSAQIAGTNAYLQGDYVELGVNGNGTYVADNDAPGFFNAASGYSGFGMASDSDKDGWGFGDPIYCGDYFEPGAPEEGFAMKVSGASYSNTYYEADFVGSLMFYSVGAGGPVVTWQGANPAAGIQVSQSTTIPTGTATVLTTVKIKNISMTPLSNVYYSRNVDPDNDYGSEFSFITNNVVVQNHPADEWAMVTATGTLTGCYLALASKQTNSVASYGGFSTLGMDAAAAYNGMSPYATSGSITTDGALQMNFKIPSLNPGETRVLNFIYGTNQADMEDMTMFTTDEVARQMELQENGAALYQADFRISPNPSNGNFQLFAFGFSETAQLHIDIMDMNGRQIWASALANQQGQAALSQQLPVEWPNGMYVATLSVDGMPLTQTFLLQR